jgi:hypothetical protein
VRNTAGATGGKPIAICSGDLSGLISGVSAINPLVSFYDIHVKRERCYFFVLSRTPHETTRFLCIICMDVQKISVYVCIYVLNHITSHNHKNPNTSLISAYFGLGSFECLEHV